MNATYRAVVIGVSAGGLVALRRILSPLQRDFPLPIVIVQHLSPQAESHLASILNELSPVTVKEAEDKEPLLHGVVYVAPPDYHVLVEPDGSLTLSVDPKVNYSRPSIDVLFESAADAFGPSLIGIILTGANSDGARGLADIRALGGLTIVQDPESAQAPAMPLAALEATEVDYILPLPDIGPFLNHLTKARHARTV